LLVVPLMDAAESELDMDETVNAKNTRTILPIELQNEYNTYLFHALPKICTYIIHGDFLFLVFCDKDGIAEHKKSYTIFKENLGVGDYFIIHSLRHEYFKGMDMKNTYILGYDKFNDNFDYSVFEKIHELKYNNTRILNFWLNNFKDDYSATIQSFRNSDPCHATTCG